MRWIWCVFLLNERSEVYEEHWEAETCLFESFRYHFRYCIGSSELVNNLHLKSCLSLLHIHPWLLTKSPVFDISFRAETPLKNSLRPLPYHRLIR